MQASYTRITRTVENMELDLLRSLFSGKKKDLTQKHQKILLSDIIHELI